MSSETAGKLRLHVKSRLMLLCATITVNPEDVVEDGDGGSYRGNREGGRREGNFRGNREGERRFDRNRGGDHRGNFRGERGHNRRSEA